MTRTVAIFLMAAAISACTSVNTSTTSRSVNPAFLYATADYARHHPEFCHA